MNKAGQRILFFLIAFAGIYAALRCSQVGKSSEDTDIPGRDDPYALEYQIDGETLSLHWNSVENITDYALNISVDGGAYEARWVSGTEYALPLSSVEGDCISFMVAASGCDYSPELTCFLRYHEQALPLNPVGTTVKGSHAFCWDAAPYADFYEFELLRADGTEVKRERTSLLHVMVKKLKLGDYKWRVTPYADENMAGQPSDWTYVTVCKELACENILGVERDAVTAPLNTALVYPECCVIGPDGALYVSDSHSNAIRRCADGKVEVFVGTLVDGFNGDGHRLEVSISQPGKIDFDPDGNMIFSDMGNHRIRKVDMTTGQVTTLIQHDLWSKNFEYQEDGSVILYSEKGAIYQWKDGTISRIFSCDALMSAGAAVQAGDRWYILDVRGCQLAMFEDGLLKKTLEVPGYSCDLKLYNGELYLGGHTAIYKVDPELNELHGFSDGYANVTYLSFSETEAGTRLIVTDSDSGTVFDVDAATGEKTPIIGGTAVLGGITDIVKHENALFLLDNLAACVWKYDCDTGLTERYVGKGDQELAAIGANRLETGLFYAAGLAVDAAGNLYIGEQHHILKVDAETGIVELFAGAPGRGDYGYNGEGVSAADALFQSIRGLSYDDAAQALYVADTYNNCVRKIQNGVVTTVAGDSVTGEPTYSIPAADSHLNRPHGVLYADGNLWISDSWNNTVSRVDGDGLLHPAAGEVYYFYYQGEGGFSGDGGDALAADLNTPLGLYYEKGALYIVDAFNNRIRIVVDGNIYTLIGTDQKGYSKDQMTLNLPNCVYADEQFVYVADGGNHLLRRYDKSALTVGGTPLKEVLR